MNVALDWTKRLDPGQSPRSPTRLPDVLRRRHGIRFPTYFAAAR
jgi:hypothetical protein